MACDCELEGQFAGNLGPWQSLNLCNFQGFVSAAMQHGSKGIANFQMSEPEFLIQYIDRHQDWAAIVCLVGGGQEIGSGEAGIGAWIDACLNRFAHWHLAVSERLMEAEYGAGEPVRRAVVTCG